jgi:uncharacterized membrane protein (DUF106 family)
MVKESGFRTLIIIMLIPLAIAGLWDALPVIKNSVHYLLDPSAGVILNWNLTLGMTILVFILSLFTVTIQKYTTDQKTLKEIRKEQKILQKEMQKYRDHPEKMMELQKKSFEFIPKTMKLTTRSLAYTAVPLILLFRWFMDFFTSLGNPKFLGFLNWFWFYLITFMIISGVIKKALKVV